LSALRKNWRGVVFAGILALGLAVPCPSFAAAGLTELAKYEAAGFDVSGSEGVSYLRKTGNNPRFTSAGSLLVMYGTGRKPQTASITVDTPAAASRVIVPVRGEACKDPGRTTFGRWPHFMVSIDNSTVISTFATSHRWQKTTARIDLPAGRHTVTLVYDNEFANPGVCDRNLRVDYVAFYGATGSDPAPFPQTTWAPIGTNPLADIEAASLVTHMPETRLENVPANNYRPSDGELAAFFGSSDPNGVTPARYNPLVRYVTGRPGLRNPSTDDLIQWAAHKWGIPEDLVRAQMVTESSWRQSALGDRATVSPDWYAQYPAQAQVTGTSDVYQSMGISQVKWLPDNSLHTGTEPLRWKSVAFNLDFYGATVRYYYDGLCTWCTLGYGAGQEWNSVGAWFNPQPWLNGGQLSYIQQVMDNLASRTWEGYSG
jgi:hypothetical protein